MKNVYSDNVMSKNRTHKGQIILKLKVDMATIHKPVVLKPQRENKIIGEVLTIFKRPK